MRTRSIAFHPDGLTLEAELVIPSDARALVVLCHGIPSGGPPPPDDPGYAGFAHRVAEAGAGAVWFNFRGCRTSPGDFSAAGWAQDLATVLDALAADAEAAPLPLVVVGSSMGGATAIAVAARRRDVAAVATLAAPATVAEITADPTTFLHRARNAGVIRDPAFPPDEGAWAGEFDALAAAAHVSAIAPRPLLLVHGDADEVVPYADAEALFALAGEPKELVRVEHGGHQLRRDPRAVDALLDWLERRLGVPNAPFAPHSVTN
jgi:putative redox protein